MVTPAEDRQPTSELPADHPEHLHAQVRKLVLMKETGPKSAAWHRARVRTIWRLQQRAADALTTEPRSREEEA